MRAVLNAIMLTLGTGCATVRPPILAPATTHRRRLGRHRAASLRATHRFRWPDAVPRAGASGRRLTRRRAPDAGTAAVRARGATVTSCRAIGTWVPPLKRRRARRGRPARDGHCSGGGCRRHRRHRGGPSRYATLARVAFLELGAVERTRSSIAPGRPCLTPAFLADMPRSPRVAWALWRGARRRWSAIRHRPAAARW